MPGFDRTGPEGRGPLTGWGRGYCGASSAHDWPRFRGFGGGGRGWRNRFFGAGMRGRFWYDYPARYEAPLSDEEELKLLQEEASYYEKELKHIREDIEQLKSKTKKQEK